MRRFAQAVRAGLAALALAGCAAGPAPPRSIAIVGATVIDVARELPEAVRPDMTVVITGERITAVGPAASTAVPRGAQVVAGAGRWVVPGLVDAHVHFFQSGNLYTRPDVVDLNAQVPYRDEVARNQARLPVTLRSWLASGVTSVLDLGGPLWNFEVRRLARASEAAPRVAVAGPLISLVDDAPLDLGDPPIIKVRTPAEARRLAEQQAARVPDVIKVWFIHDEAGDLAAEEAIVAAVAEVAHRANIPLAVHATELVVAKAALRAGADYLVHSVEDKPVDDEFIALMKWRGAAYCPTLFVTLGYDLALSDQWRATEAERRLADPQVLAGLRGIADVPRDRLPAWVAQALAEKTAPVLSPVMAANLRRVQAAGLTVVMGTDAGNIGTVHGPSVFREMALMHEAGLSPLQVLRSATLNGATVLRQGDRLGRVAPGQGADLLLLEGDPLDDLANLARAALVVKGGRAYRPDELVAPAP